MLTPFNTERLAKILALTGSIHDGEALAAARKAHALVTEIGLQWRDIIVPGRMPDEPVHLAPHCFMAQRLLDHGKRLMTPFERQFLLGILGFHNLSQKQAQTLENIRLKVETAKPS